MKVKLTILLFAFLTANYSFGQIELEDLHVDTTITGFHFAADFQGTKIFTKNGPPDIQTINPTAYSFTIVQNFTVVQAKQQLEMLLNMSIQNGYEITDLVKKDTTLNGNRGFYISYTETDEKTQYKNLVFNAFVIKDKTLILFTSGDLDKGLYVEKFKRTFYSIKL